MPRDHSEALLRRLNQTEALLTEAQEEREALAAALRWCGDHGDNGCFEKANATLASLGMGVE